MANQSKHSELYIIAEPNGAGKTTFARLVLEIISQAANVEQTALQTYHRFQELLTGLEELASRA